MSSLNARDMQFVALPNKRCTLAKNCSSAAILSPRPVSRHVVVMLVPFGKGLMIWGQFYFLYGNFV